MVVGGNLPKYGSDPENSFTYRKRHYWGVTYAIFYHHWIKNLVKIIVYVNQVEEKRAVDVQRNGHRSARVY